MTTTVPTLPTIPSRSRPATFASEGDAFLGALDPWGSAVQTVGEEAYASAVAAAASADTATTQAGLATTNGAAQVVLATAQATNAANSATAAANSALVAGATIWVSGTTYAIGDARYSPINFQTYRRTTNGGGTTDPSLDNTNWTKALESGISNVVTATGMTALTSTPTLLKITPASYGVAVTLPDATTCSLGGPLHIIDNKGAYPVKVLNSAGTLLGFIFAGVVSHVSLSDNSTAAGVWSVENSELVGASAQLLTTAITSITACVSLDSSREYIQGYNGSGHLVGLVYNKTTNTFGNVTAIRTVAGGSNYQSPAVLSATDQILCCSCGNGATTFEAVTLSISGTTITVNTAATATLSANISAFADGCGLIAVGSSFVTSYTVATPAAQIRALSISGTTVTIGSATVLDGTAGGLIAASSDKVIAVSTATTHLYTKPYTVSGSTLTPGTGTDSAPGSTIVLYKFFALGSRWCVLFNDSSVGPYGAVVSLSGTTATISSVATITKNTSVVVDAIVVGSNKVLVLANSNDTNANILTDTAGTASAGTAITLDAGTVKRAMYVNGTSVAVYSPIAATTSWVNYVDCSGASPVLTLNSRLNVSTDQTDTFAGSNSVLSRSPQAIFGTNFCQNYHTATVGVFSFLRVSGAGAIALLPRSYYGVRNSSGISTCYRGKADSERWVADAATVITKIECVA
jgi:hypothetical protein